MQPRKKYKTWSEKGSRSLVPARTASRYTETVVESTSGNSSNINQSQSSPHQGQASDGNKTFYRASDYADNEDSDQSNTRSSQGGSSPLQGQDSDEDNTLHHESDYADNEDSDQSNSRYSQGRSSPLQGKDSDRHSPLYHASDYNDDGDSDQTNSQSNQGLTSPHQEHQSQGRNSLHYLSDAGDDGVNEDNNSQQPSQERIQILEGRANGNSQHEDRMLSDFQSEFEDDIPYSPPHGLLHRLNLETNDDDQDEDEDHQSEGEREAVLLNNDPPEVPNYDDSQIVGPSHSKLKQKMTPEFMSIIREQPVASYSEILLNALKLSELHDWSHLEHTNVMKLINSIFGSQVVPDTRYLLDQLYLSSCGISQHFYCDDCTALLEVDPNNHSDIIQCKNGTCTFMNSLSKLKTECKYFVTFNIPRQLENLFQKSSDLFNKLGNPFDLVSTTDNLFKDVYNGSVYQSFVQQILPNPHTKVLSFVMCADSTPVFKSSNCSVLPLFLQINELPPLERMNNLIIAGLWFGSSKPKYDLFFKPLINEIKKLSSSGCKLTVSANDYLFKCYLIGCCSDSGARGAIQGIHAHNGECGCNWCLQKGETEGGGSSARKYEFSEEEEKRTSDNYKRDVEAVLALPVRRTGPRPHINGVLERSVLVDAPCFDMVESMILDYPHGCCFGVARQMMKLWMGTNGIDKLPNGKLPNFYIGGPNNILKINQRLLSIQPPIEVRRFSRKVEDISSWKMREWENWILYYSLPVLSGILPEKYLKHWSLFVQAMFLLLKSEISNNDIIVAEDLLTNFVRRVAILYPNVDKEINPEKPCKQMTFNIHMLLHLGDHVRRWGPLFCCNSYSFENGNGNIKNMIKANKGIDNQILRRLGQRSSIDVLQPVCSTANTDRFELEISRRILAEVLTLGDINIIGKRINFNPNEEELFLLRSFGLNPSLSLLCQKLIRKGCCFTTNASGRQTKSKNSIVLLNTGEVVCIKKIVLCSESEILYILCSSIRFGRIEWLHAYLLNEVLFKPIFLFERGLKIVPFQNVSKICVMIDLNDKEKFVTAMPNIINTV